MTLRSTGVRLASNHNFLATLNFICVLTLCVHAVHAQNSAEANWTLPDSPPAWARNSEGFSATTQTDPSTGISVTHIVHSAPTDWATRIPERINVQPGEVYCLSWKIKNAGVSSCETGVILYDAQGQALDWSFGGSEIFSSDEWQRGENSFITPRGVAQIEARVIGSGQTDVYIESFSLHREHTLALETSKDVSILENQTVRVSFNCQDASFSVEDKRTQRVWRQPTGFSSQFVTKVDKESDAIVVSLLDGQTLFTYQAKLELDADKPEILVTLSATPDAQQRYEITYPLPFATRPTDRLILPVNEGISFPVTEDAAQLGVIHTFGGHGLCMSFWGVVADVVESERSDGYLAIIETPDDSDVDVRKRESAEVGAVSTLCVASRWHGAMKKFGYDRKIRFVFFDRGGYVAQCKRYREFAKSVGRLITFQEKAAQNHKLADGLQKLLGAANIWCWDGKNVQTVEKLKSLGIDRILWSAGGSAEELDVMNKMKNVLTSRYDIYQDVMNPDRYSEVSWVHSDWTPEAWPQDLVWDSPDGHWTRGWSVDAKDPTQPRIPCGVLCDSRAIPYAEKRISQELKEKDYRARFLDTTVASPWRECWNPDHVMTRSQCKDERMKLLKLLHSFGLVCGSETGIDVSAPYCDFFEGMMSLGPYRCPESGRYLTKIWDETPELVQKYQLGESYRLPLFELVYHDCVVSYWYWGDHNNKFPEFWSKRDLFNALYGTPPMYCFTQEFLAENEQRFAESYAVASKVAYAAQFSEMTDHRILTNDRKVQMSSFANGIDVVVNFGDENYELAPGVSVAPKSLFMTTSDASTK